LNGLRILQRTGVIKVYHFVSESLNGLSVDEEIKMKNFEIELLADVLATS
jgi:hypothetical protein